MQSEEQRLALNDSKYRSYVTVMDKALKAFESTNEWADLISALTKVIKVVSNHKNYTYLPKKVTIGKRLAQCLHPALPAGVHIKALELYEVIFKVIGPSLLAKDFPIYSAGLLPLLSHAAMTVKPMLLRIYENFVLPLSSSIRPAATGLILGILPGLEEGSEFHERTNTLLDNFCKSFGAEHFYNSLWSCLYSSPSIRLPGTSYLLSHIDKARSIEDQLYLLGNDLSLLVSALRVCLEDSAVLVQRNTLDILVIAFPFHDSQLTKADQSDVIESAILVLLRRDMSLNRRLYGWFLGITTAGTRVVKKSKHDADSSNKQRHDSGSSSASEPELEYFNLHSRRLLVQSLRSLLDGVNGTSSDIIKPLRVIISLLDRVEIGSLILEDILVNIFKYLRRFYSLHTEKELTCNRDLCTYSLALSLNLDLQTFAAPQISTTELSPKIYSELFKTCNLLFATLEPPFLWQYLADTYEKVLWPSEVRQDTCLSMSEYCDMVNMLLSIVSLESYVEIQTVHIPRLLYNLLNMMKENISDSSLSNVTQVLTLCRRLITVIQPQEVIPTEDGMTGVSVQDCVQAVHDIISTSLLATGSQKATDDENRKCALVSCCLLLIEMSRFPVYSTKCSASSAPSGDKNVPEWIKSLISAAIGDISCDTQCQFISAAFLLDLIKLADSPLEKVVYRSRSASVSPTIDSFSLLDQNSLCTLPVIDSLVYSAVGSQLENVFRHVWSQMDAAGVMFSKESSLLLSALLTISFTATRSVCAKGESLQTIVIKDLTHKKLEKRLEAYKKFTLFWHQTRDLQTKYIYTEKILMAALSSLINEAEVIQEVVRDWIIHSVQCDDVNRILEPLLLFLLESDTSRSSVQQKSKSSTSVEPSPEEGFAKSLEAAQKQIKSISSDGRVRMKTESSKQKHVKPPTQSLVTKEGQVTSSNMATEPLDYKKATKFTSAGLALNPFGTASDLDYLIFDGFTPHESLKNRWSAVSKGEGSTDYNTIISKAKRLDKETCDREGIVFGEETTMSHNQGTSHDSSDKNLVSRGSSHEQGEETDSKSADEKEDDTSAGKPIEAPQADSNKDSKSKLSRIPKKRIAPQPECSKAKQNQVPVSAIPLPARDMPHRVIAEPPPLDQVVEDEVEAEASLRSTDRNGDASLHSSNSGHIGDNTVTVKEAPAVFKEVSKSYDGVTDDSDRPEQVVDRRRSSAMSATAVSTGLHGSRESTGKDSQPEIMTDDSLADSTAGILGFALIYDQCYDTERVQFSLNIIQKIIAVNPSLILSSLTASTCSDSKVLSLLARHKRSLEGDNFYTDLSHDEIISLRNVRLLEILVMVCLYFWRSYHSTSHTNPDCCVSQNSQVQLKSIHLLTSMAFDLCHILADSPKGFPQYLVDVLYKYKVVKTCVFHLQCLLEERVEKLQLLGVTHDSSIDTSLFRECLQLTESLIILESKLQLVHEGQSGGTKGRAPALFKRMLFSHPSLRSCMTSHLSEARYADVHHHWLSVITNSLPHVLSQPITAELLQSVVVTVCGIFDKMSSSPEATVTRSECPPDYVQQLMEDFTVICHFCFMDVSGSQSGLEESKPSGISTGQILSNLVNVFNPLTRARNSLNSDQGAADRTDCDPRVRCRDSLLSILPKILSSVSNLWRLHHKADNLKIVQLVVEFFSPILHNYAEELLGSVAVVWSDSQDLSKSAHLTQSTLVELLISIKALPMETIVEKLGVVMKKPPATDHQTNSRLDLVLSSCEGDRDQVILQLSCLKFLKGYITKTTSIPKSSMSSVCSLLKQCLQLGLPAPGILLLLETVTEFVYKLGNIDDRKLAKDLQEIVGKVLEACCQIVSSQLEASSWTIRKNYTVKVKAPSSDSSNDLYNMASDSMSSAAPGISVDDAASTEEHESEYTSHALALLAEVTAGLLDVVYPSEDKDKVASLLNNILTRVFPYLRNHSLLNMSSFQSSSKLLASISSYQYTRRTWRRDVYDIILSNDFFRMDAQSLQFWKILTDNLVTHEKAMLKDLLAKFMLAGNAAIQLFSTKDSEFVQRAHNLKKLSFLIYCGDIDHYKNYMPDIQERLAENLRLTQSPSVLSQVFLCFRVLLLRMSPNALTSLWPTIITELVNVMIHIEDELVLSEEEEHQLSRVSEMDSFSNINEANVNHSVPWLQFYLAACKLLDLVTFLPSHLVPDFQHYIWMFCGTDDSTPSQLSPPINGLEEIGTANGETPIRFSAHIPNISQLMTFKFGEYRTPSNQSTALLLQQQAISSLRDLQPFFARLLTNHNRAQSCDQLKEAHSVLDNDMIEPVLY